VGGGLSPSSEAPLPPPGTRAIATPRERSEHDSGLGTVQSERSDRERNASGVTGLVPGGTFASEGSKAGMAVTEGRTG
jgi:hypothetical protein